MRGADSWDLPRIKTVPAAHQRLTANKKQQSTGLHGEGHLRNKFQVSAGGGVDLPGRPAGAASEPAHR